MVQKDIITSEKKLLNNYDVEKNMVLTIDEIKSLIDNLPDGIILNIALQQKKERLWS